MAVLKYHKKMINSIECQRGANYELEVLAASEDGDVTLWSLPFIKK